MTTQAARVREMFGSIAARYDIANHLLSCGIDFSWRERAARIVTDWHPHSVADLATGTGDVARNQEQWSLARARVLTANNTNLAGSLSFLSTSLPADSRFLLNRKEKC